MPRRFGLLWVIWSSVVLALSSSVVAQSPTIYNVFNMPAGLTSLKFSNVGDPGNVADTAVMNTSSEDILNINGSPDHSSGYGSVAYNYAMGTYDVTAAQYVQFLNAVARTSDPYGLYNPLMGGATSGPYTTDPGDPIGQTTQWVTISSGSYNYPVVCGITRTGTAGNYTYALSTSAAANLGSPPIPADNGNFPINWDNWGDAARFCNWLENGQPTGQEGPGTTETGTYTLNGATTVQQLFTVTKNPGATYWIPTENEWYKAAYYKTGGTNAGYWTYTTKSNTSPSDVYSATGTNNANFNSSGLQAAVPWILTPVGAYADSPGPYGTYDMGGDLYQFTSTPVTQSTDGTGEGLYVYVMRGGSFHKSDAEEEDSDYRTGADPAKYGHGRTFRVASWYTTVWNGGGTGSNATNWSTPGNWTGAVPMMAGGVGMAVQFGPLSGGHAANNNDLAAGTQINGISFAAGAAVYNLTGNSILLGGPVTNQSGSVQTIGLAMQLVAGGGTFNTAAGNITLTGPLSGGTTPLVKSGTGTLTLAGSNTFSGQTQVSSAGALLLANAGALQNSTYVGGAANGLAFAPIVGAFTLGGLSGSDNLTLSDTGGVAVTLQVGNNGASSTYSGTLSGVGGLVKVGSGVLALTGVNTYQGPTGVNQGTLALGPGGSLNNTSVTVGNGASGNGVLQVNGSYAIGNLAVNGGGSATGQGAVSFNPAETNTSTLTVGGGMTVGGSSGNPGLLNFNLGKGTVDTITVSGMLTANSGGAIIGLNQLPGTLIVSGTYNLMTFNSGSGLGGLTFAGGASILTQGSDGFRLVSTTGAEELAVVMLPANAYWTGAQGTSSWSTAVNGSNTNWGSTAAGADTNMLPGATTNIFFTASGASNYGNTTLDGNFGINSLTFNTNPFGPMSIGPGTSSSYALTIYGSGGITVDAGAGAVVISAPLILGGSQTWTNNSPNLLTISSSSSVANSGNTLALAGSGNIHISAVIGGTGGLVNNSSGIVTLSGANTFSGQTQVSGPSALLLANSAALQNSTYVGGAANGLAFAPNVGMFTLGGLSGNSALTLADTGGVAVTLQLGNNGASTTYAGTLSGPGGLTKIGSGTLALTGVNTYQGATGVSQGTLALGPGGSLNNTSVTVGNGTLANGTLQVNGSYAIGGNLAVNGGGSTTGQGAVTFNPAETNTSTLTVGGAMSVGGASGNPGLLNFNLGNNSVDTIAVNGALTINAGGAIIGLNELSGMSIISGTYSLITFSNVSGLGGLTFAGGATTTTQKGDTLTLINTTGAEELSVIAPPINAYWTGARGTSWSTLTRDDTNWGSTTAGPDTNALPGGNSNVFFTASAASNYANTTLDGNFSINSLTFSNSGAMGIAAGTPATSTLTITDFNGASAITTNPGAGAATISAPLALAASQTWTNNSSNPLTVSGSVANGGNTLTLAGSGTTTISGVIGSGSGGVVAAGSGLVVLAASNTYTGATTVNGGSLTLSGTSGAINGTSSVTVGPGATLLIDNRGGADNTRIPNATGITLNGGTFTYLGNSAASTSETVGALTLGPGASTIAISGYGNNSSSTDNSTLIFGSGSTFTNSLRRTAMSGSMLDVTTAIPGQGGPGSTGYPNSGGDFVLFGGLSANGGPASINTPADWIVVNGHDIPRWSGSHGIHELGISGVSGGQVARYFNLGTATANGNVLVNSTSAQTALTANTTINSLVVQSASAQTSTLTGYTLNIENTGSGSSNPLDNNGGIIVSGSADFTLSGGYTINGGTITSGKSGAGINSELFTWIDSGTTTINSVIADIGSGGATLLAKAGSGTLVLGGANTYSAGTALDQGVLNFASGTLPYGAANIHFYGGTLQWASGNNQDISAGIAPIGSGETAILDTNGNSVSFATGLSGNGELAKVGNGVLSLLGVNTYSGPTTISAGTLQLGNGAAGNDGSIAGNSIINNAALVYDLFGSQTYGGAISGSGSLTQAGTATLVLTGNNTYSGATMISAGVLMAGASNTLSANSAVTVNGGTLDASAFANTVEALTITGGGLNLGLGNTLTCSGPATLAGTLNVVGTGTLGSYKLLSYTSKSGSFASSTLDPNYGLLYTATELDAEHKAQVGILAVTAANATVISGGTTALTVGVNNSVPAASDALNFTAVASGSGYGGSTTGSLAAASSGTYTLASGFNSASLPAGSYTGTVTVTGTNSALGGPALNSGAAQTVTVNVLGHAAPSLSVANGNSQTVIVGAPGISAGLSLSNGTQGQSGLASLDVNSLGAGVNGLTGGALVASGASQSYTAALDTTTLGAQVQNFSLNVGDDQTLPGASPAANVSTGVSLTVLGHAAPSLSVANGNSQTVIVGAPGISAGLSLSNGTQGQSGLASLDVNSLGASVAGSTGGALVASGASQSYTAALNTSTLGAQVQNFSLNVGDDQTLPGASPAADISAGVNLTVLDHAAGSVTVTAGNGFLAHAGATDLSATIALNNAVGTRSDLEVDSAPIITQGVLGSGPATPYFVSAGSAQTYTATFDAGSTPGPFSSTVTFASAGDRQSLPGAGALGSLVVSITGNVYSGKAQWNAGNGSWAASGNWQDTVSGGPSGAPGLSGYITDTATFGAAATSGTVTVTLDSAAPLLSSVVFSNSNASYLILQGSGTTGLTLTGTDANSPATVAVQSGTHWMEVPIMLDSNLEVSSSGSLTLSGNISDGGLGMSLTLDGGGELILSGSNSYGGGTLVDDGALVVTSSGALPAGTGLTVGAGGTLLYDPSVVSSPGTDGGTVVAVPEPGTLVLLLAGFLAAALATWRGRTNY